MSYWNRHPEKLEEITIDALPEPYKELVKDGEVGLSDVPDDVVSKAMMTGTENYWADISDNLKRDLRENK